MSKFAEIGFAFFERRKAKRTKLFEPAKLSDGRGEREAHILDLSSGGALVHADLPPKVGTPITLRFTGVTALGRVVWAENCHFGIAFISVPIGPVGSQPIVSAARTRKGAKGSRDSE